MKCLSAVRAECTTIAHYAVPPNASGPEEMLDAFRLEGIENKTKKKQTLFFF